MDFRYAAFISYSHEDSRFAKWLHRALETYRPPVRARDEIWPGGLSPIFLDRSELRSSSDLGAELRDAIANSSAMVVVCSRSAAASPWVNQEIELFCELHGPERVFAIIANDEPPDCFPPALKGEPVAADARRGKDGRRDALLKTVAALVEVPFDSLKRRDLRRQYQRMTIAASVAAIIATATIVLALVAFDARREADRRSAQAEDLIGFMLGDLRARLEPSGRLDVLDAVGDKALEYFESLSDDELTNDALLGRAKALRQIGEVRFSQSRYDEALEVLEFANHQLEALLRNGYEKEVVIFELGQSNFWTGYVYYLREDIEAARSNFERYIELSEDLLEIDPDNEAYRVEVAYALSNLGTMEFAQNRPQIAKPYFVRASQIFEKFVNEDPRNLEYRINLAESLSWLGGVAAKSGTVPETISWFRREFEIKQEIADLSNEAGHRFALARSVILLGQQETIAGDFEVAESTLSYALELGRGLVEHDPTNRRWGDLLALAHTNYAQVLVALGDLDGAEREVNKTIEYARELADSENTTQNDMLLGAQLQLARIMRMTGRDSEALETLGHAAAVAEDLRTEESGVLALTLAEIGLMKGDFSREAGDTEESSRQYRDALDTLAYRSGNLSEPAVLLTRRALYERLEMIEEASGDRQTLRALGVSDNPVLISAMVDGLNR